MTLDLTFNDVCLTIKKQGKEDPKLIEAVDKLLGLALICSPVVLGPAAAVALLPTLAEKNEIIKIGKGVFEKLTKKKNDDYAKRQETMQMAYGLLVFTAFFDALDARIPKILREEIALLEPEKAFLVKDAVRKTSTKIAESTSPGRERIDSPVANVSFAFPHPIETLAEQTQRQASLWKLMRQGFVEFIQKLTFWEGADERKRMTLLSGLDKIEEEAAKLYEAQYFELARKFEDFAIWANLHEHKNAKALIGELSDYVKQHARLSAVNGKAIDVGFSKLHEAVLSIPETLRTSQASELADSLNRHYQARINDPIIDDKESIDEEKPRLSFPRACDAFVPQAFRVLTHGGKSRRLEEESTWSGLPRRNDLGAFLLSYLSSPYSTESPLLVLGHPGSGKSLLTTILSAQLMSKHFTAIRVPLREVNADADIVTQIEDAIRRITGVSVDSWIKLSALFKNCPPLVILDGYDELLQASGQVFASYIKDAQRLQEREAEQGRPLRIVITSRVTLIDKAAVPPVSTIIRLLEFDKNQRDRWSAIWNKSNASYFKDALIEEFSLPSEKDPGADRILTLAGQPLLLLMLALYDSQENQLRKSKGLDRTKLYDSLLRRFVIRERGKEKGFNDAKKREREKALGCEMQRLGVAALGMYNRRKVHILAPELDEDLGFFKLEREVAAKPGRALSQADLLLGSFFFVHKSKAQHNTGAAHEETSAFEFLHNTFGEFLTADFILRRAVAQVQALRASEANEALRSMLEKMMGTADGFERDWFASLVYTPLFTRPVIMEMMREWAPHVFKEQGLIESDFVESLEKIVLNQIKRLLNKREMPSIIRKETAQEGYRVPFGDHPLIGHVAIYSMNLILLRLIVGTRPFVFDETEVASHEDGTRPWDRLIHIWRSWFALGNLSGLTAVMLARRAGSKITVAAKKNFQAEEAKGRLQECFNVALSLGDNVASGLSGLFLFNPSSSSSSELDLLEQRLESEGLDLRLAITLKRLLVLASNFPASIDDFVRLGGRSIEQVLESGRPDELEYVCLIVSRALEWMTPQSSYRLWFRDLISPLTAAEVAMRDARSGSVLWALAKQAMDPDWQIEFSRRLLDYMLRMRPTEMMGSRAQNGIAMSQLLRDVGRGASRFADRHLHSLELSERALHPRDLLELSERNPEGALAYIQMLRQLGGGRFLERYFERELGPEFFERLFHPGHLLELSERNPEGALAYVQMLRELGGGSFLERGVEKEMGQEFFTRHLSSDDLNRVFDRKPSAMAVWLTFARMVNSRGMTELLSRSMFECLRRSSGIGIGLESLPISAIPDLHWLAAQSNIPELATALSDLGAIAKR
jgi:hypothetical protein